MKKNLLFALDIGTRSVVGLVGEQTEHGIEIIASERREHHTRAMLDGQIKDVPEVAKIIAIIKNKLEETCGPLQKVSVAAAGRALCTIKSQAEIEAYDRGILTKIDEHALELAAIQSAQQQLSTSNAINDPTAYYCVGYSVVSFTLDTTPLKTLVGQRGKLASIELIATFLPKQVIDSLQSAITMVNLEMATLTLEPIAAINVLIPQTMRHLNLVLVDVGAGTSDVAITKDGSVIGYGMVPCAGDEITESISQKHLLDFNVAEKIKRQLTDPEINKVTFNDVLGFSHEVPTSEIIDSITQDVAQLAQAIALQIVTLNNVAPQAVLLVGGGSLTPMLPELLAQALDMPASRVAVRCPDTIEGLHNIPTDLCAPDAVTPLGILKLSASPTLNFINVTLNKQPLHLFNLGQLTIADALLAAGIDIRSLRGRPGMGITINTNGQTKFFSGTYGKPGRIELNGSETSLDHPLHEDDTITVIKGVDGSVPVVYLRDIVDTSMALPLFINEQSHYIPSILTVNGIVADPESQLTDRDQVTCRLPLTLGEVLTATGSESEPIQYIYTINGSERIYSVWPQYTLNQTLAQASTPVKAGDTIRVINPPEPTISELLGLHDPSEDALTLLFNGAKCQIPLRRFSITMNGIQALPTDIAPKGSIIDFSCTEQPHPMISDVLLAADFNTRDLPRGSSVMIHLNQQPTEYTAIVKNGDEVDILVTTIKKFKKI
ncbi:cell division protein FtsA [Pelosinus sp. sgz500959]|uniref:cell division protein FtsA n=1 Tax=Pelosinus sp. sgz500959 TaxID=3242472 RepID=UPI00366E5156